MAARLEGIEVAGVCPGPITMTEGSPQKARAALSIRPSHSPAIPVQVNERRKLPARYVSQVRMRRVRESGGAQITQHRSPAAPCRAR